MSYIINTLSSIVAQMSSELVPMLSETDSNITVIRFEKGAPHELNKILKLRDQSTGELRKKYPAVFLFLDYPEDMQPMSGIWSRATLHLALVNFTDPNYLSDQRDEKNFEPILEPMYECFMRLVQSNSNIMTPALLPHTRTKRYYWGTEDGNNGTFISPLDAIEIRNLQLSFYPQRNDCTTQRTYVAQHNN